MAIKCCRPCKPPKRYPGCHDHCPEYAKEKAEHNAEKAAADKKRAIEGGLAAQALRGVNRANKARQRLKKR